jgi:hypothetical protein
MTFPINICENTSCNFIISIKFIMKGSNTVDLIKINKDIKINVKTVDLKN